VLLDALVEGAARDPEHLGRPQHDPALGPEDGLDVLALDGLQRQGEDVPTRETRRALRFSRRRSMITRGESLDEGERRRGPEVTQRAPTAIV